MERTLQGGTKCKNVMKEINEIWENKTNERNNIKGKARGLDKVKEELLSIWAGRNRIFTRNSSWRTKTVPEEWKISVIIPIHKKATEKNARII